MHAGGLVVDFKVVLERSELNWASVEVVALAKTLDPGDKPISLFPITSYSKKNCPANAYSNYVTAVVMS